MNQTELRVEALRLAVATQGNPNNLQLAQEYLGFLTVADERPAAPKQQGKQR